MPPTKIENTLVHSADSRVANSRIHCRQTLDSVFYTYLFAMTYILWADRAVHALPLSIQSANWSRFTRARMHIHLHTEQWALSWARMVWVYWFHILHLIKAQIVNIYEYTSMYNIISLYIWGQHRFVRTTRTACEQTKQQQQQQQ